MIKRLWFQTPAPYTGWMKAIQAITYTKITKIKVSKWGKPKKKIKRRLHLMMKGSLNNAIIWLMLSQIPWPKVIQLIGTFCNHINSISFDLFNWFM
jgi:hypothetical protein